MKPYIASTSRAFTKSSIDIDQHSMIIIYTINSFTRIVFHIIKPLVLESSNIIEENTKKFIGLLNAYNDMINAMVISLSAIFIGLICLTIFYSLKERKEYLKKFPRTLGKIANPIYAV